MSFLIRNKISLLVCDMAGTIINENGIIYESIFNTLTVLGYEPIYEDIKKWTGLSKRKVLYDEIYKKTEPIGHENISSKVDIAEKMLLDQLEEEYFSNNNIELVNDEVLDFFDNCRINNIQVALNTGYSGKLQNKIIEHLNIKNRIDAYISSDDVSFGRPYPYMINKLMEEFNIINPNHIAKIGDTKNDMLEGRNSHCGLTIGVLTGYESKENLIKAGADVVINQITDLKDDELPIFLL